MKAQASATYDGTMDRTGDGGVIRFERRLAYPVSEAPQV